MSLYFSQWTIPLSCSDKWSALTLERVIGSELIILWIWSMPKVFSADWMESLSSADVLQLSKGHSADVQRLLEIKVHSWDCLFSMWFVLLKCWITSSLSDDLHLCAVTASADVWVCMITTRLDDSQLKVKGLVHQKIIWSSFTQTHLLICPVSFSAAHLNFHYWFKYMKHKIRRKIQNQSYHS